MIIKDELYQQILQVMPIPCVDLLVENGHGQVLLAKRINEPGKGEWWFPGGRVHFLEPRLQAAIRKLKEECGLDAKQTLEIGTYDVVVERTDSGQKLHAITTLFHVSVDRFTGYTLDSQNSEADWCLPDEWLNRKLHPFVNNCLQIFMKKI